MITIGTAAAAPGETAWGTLSVHAAGRDVALPVCIVNGREDGEHVVAIGSQHGRERNGIEAIRRCCAGLDPTTLKGAFVAVPCANPLAVYSGEEVFLERELAPAELGKDPYHTDLNMNYNWPGRTDSSLVAATVHAIWHHVIHASQKPVLVVDMHGHANATAVYAQNRQVALLGLVAGIRHVIITGEGDIDSCNRACAAADIISMTIELEGKDVVTPSSVADGVSALTNLLAFHGLIAGDLALPDRAWIHDPWRDHLQPELAGPQPSFVICEAEHSGVVVQHRLLYDCVHAGDLICEIVNPHSAQIVAQCRAPMDGSIYGYRTPLPGLATAGERLVVIGRVEELAPARTVAGLQLQDFLHVQGPDAT
jgi:predicted deacylase